MRFEVRVLSKGMPTESRQLLIFPDNKYESDTLDFVFGYRIPAKVEGERTLSDGYGQDYVRLELNR